MSQLVGRCLDRLTVLEIRADSAGLADEASVPELAHWGLIRALPIALYVDTHSTDRTAGPGARRVKFVLGVVLDDRRGRLSGGYSRRILFQGWGWGG